MNGGFWSEEPGLEEDLSKVRDLVLEAVRTDRFPLADAVSELISANGKMLRPALMIIAADFGKKGREPIRPLAAACELLHVATLVHDDIIDEAGLRRGLPAIHARFGIKEAVLAGDWLFARAFGLASEHAGPENTKRLSRVVSAICAAEIEQDMGKFRFATTPREYRRAIAGKTAALFALSLDSGARESGADQATCTALRRSGHAAGMAFQLIDDTLDFEGDEAVVGKPLGKDISEGLCTLPLIVARSTRAAELRPLIEKASTGLEGARSVAPEIARIVVASGALAIVRDEAVSYTRRAMAETARLRESPSRSTLERLFERLLSRAS